MTDNAAPSIGVVNLARAFETFEGYWQPRIAGEINDSHVKLAKLKGAFEWHHHATEDELFLVLRGHLLIKLRDRDLHLDPGEFVVIPHGVKHLPIAADEVHVLLIEPSSTLNTGTATSERTVANPERI